MHRNSSPNLYSLAYVSSTVAVNLPAFYLGQRGERVQFMSAHNHIQDYDNLTVI